jgi:hypothetical protein
MPVLGGLDDDLVCDALTFVCRTVRWLSYKIAFSGEINLPGLYSAAVFLHFRKNAFPAPWPCLRAFD